MAVYNMKYIEEQAECNEFIVNEGLIENMRKNARDEAMQKVEFVKKNIKTLSKMELKIYLLQFNRYLKRKKVFPDNSQERKELSEVVSMIKEEMKSKSSTKDNNQSSSKHPKIIDYTDEEVSAITAEVKAVVAKFNKDPKIKERVLSMVNDDKYGLDKSERKFFKFVADLFEEGGSYLIYEVCNQSQEYRLTVNDITYEIAKEVETAINNKGISGSVDIGDGDEGCIYIN